MFKVTIRADDMIETAEAARQARRNTFLEKLQNNIQAIAKRGRNSHTFECSEFSSEEINALRVALTREGFSVADVSCNTSAGRESKLIVYWH